MIIFLVAFGVLLAGAAPGLAPRDAGELTAAVACVGVPHPPGFPLYVLLGRAWADVMPFGSLAYRLNILSAACLAGALALLARWLSRMTTTGIALLVTAAFLVSPLAISQGTSAEIFAPVALWSAMMLTVISSEHSRRGAAAALLGGLGLALHPTAALALAGLGILWWSSRPRWAMAVALGVLGFAVTLLLPLRAAIYPPLEWGAASSVSGFIAHLLRTDYGTFRLMRDSTMGGSGESPLHLLYVLGDRMGWWFAALGVAGLAVWIRGPASAGGRRFGLALAVWAGLAGPLFGWLARPPASAGAGDALLERFALLASLPLVLGAGGALAALAGRRRAIAMAVVFGVSLVTAGRPEGTSYDLPGHDPGFVGRRLLQGREAFWAEDFARALLRSVEPGGVVLSKWDDAVFALRHEQIARGARRDVAVVMPVYLHWHAAQVARLRPDLAPPLESEWTPESSVFWSTRLLVNAAGRGPAYRAGDVETDEAAFQGYDFQVSGLTEQVVRVGETDDGEAVVGAVANPEGDRPRAGRETRPPMNMLAPRSPLSTRLCSGFDRGLVESYAAIANRAGVQAARARRAADAAYWFRLARMRDPASPVYRENLRRAVAGEASHAHETVDAH